MSMAHATPLRHVIACEEFECAGIRRSEWGAAMRATHMFDLEAWAAIYCHRPACVTERQFATVCERVYLSSPLSHWLAVHTN